MFDAAPLLRDVFGFDAFRPGQEEIVEAVTLGENVLAIMPTGGGKSLCYQLPALQRDGVTVVISPLIALMRDQVRGLQEAGVEAGALTSGNTPEETDAVWDALEAGRLKLLYMAPERLAAGSALGMLRRINVSLIAVDEAHCVSQWGHDFRPDYLRIGELRRALGVPLAAFTATADAETQDEIVEKLFDGAAPRKFLRGFDRPNIHLAFGAKDGPRKQILDFAAARKGQSGIVYCGTRNKTEALAQALRADGHSACHYHGGMEAEEECLGAGNRIDIWLGNETDKIRARNHDTLSTYGIGKAWSRSQWQAIFRQMMGHDLVRPDPDRHGALRMTEAAKPILRGAAQIELRKDALHKAKRRPAVKAMVSDEDAPLLSALKAKRRALAEAQRVPAYVIFPDRTLIEMAEKRPMSLDDMARIGGVGAKKLERYGDIFLEVIAGEVTALHPARRKLAGRDQGDIYDQLLSVQGKLARGADGFDKPLSCSASQLARVAQMRGDDSYALEQVLGARRTERFGAAFLDVLRRAG